MNDRETVRRLLERDLVEWADDTDLRLVWADLLQLDGDPLGTLVVLDHVGASATAPAEVVAQARREAELLRERLRPRLWDERLPDQPGVTLHWALGFVREVYVDVARLSHAQTPARRSWGRRSRPLPVTASDTLAWFMPRLLRQPALRWLEILRVEIPDDHDGAGGDWLRDTRIKNPCLREIHIGNPPEARVRPGGAWESRPGGAVRAVDGLGSLRRLRWLSIAGELRRIPCCPGNSQTRVHHVRSLATRPLTSQNRAALARALFDQSVLVHEVAFEVAAELGPRAEFLIDDLAWFLRPPLSKKDPRPVAAFSALARIGPASARLLPELLRAPDELLVGRRLLALLDWLTALGPAAEPARSLLAGLRRSQKSRELSVEARAALARAQAAIGTGKSR